MILRESDLENWCRGELEALGAVVIKLSARGWSGWTDRLIVGPGKYVQFVEFKRTGEEARPMQQFIHRILKEMGHDVRVIDDWEGARRLVDEFRREVATSRVPEARD